VKLKRVLVTWTDAFGDAMQQTWTTEELTSHAPIIVKTVGWLYKEDDIGVTLFTDFIEDDTPSFRGKTFIPKGMIVSVDTLIVSRKKSK
jgi:hypothetical protein